MGACAKPNADEMVTRKINDKDAFGVCIHRAGAARMREVDDQPEAFEGYGLEESTIPPLRLTSARVTGTGPSHTCILWSGRSRWNKTVHAEQRNVPSKQS